MALGIVFSLAAAAAGLIYFLSLEDFEVVKIIFKKKPAASSQNQRKDLRLLFASNGDREIYRVQRDDKWVVVIDGQESAAYDYVENATFSPDGALFAYSATLDGQSWVVLENTPQQQAYDAIKQILFNTDGSTLGYVAQKGDYSVIVLNGQESQLYQQLAPLETSSGSTYIIFSPDGESIAYKVVDNQGSHIVINGQEGTVYDDITSFVFNPDGTYTYQAELDGQEVIITNAPGTTASDTPTNTTTTITTTTTQNSGTSSTSQTSSSSKKSGKDVQLNQERLYYPTCSGEGCNF